MKISPEYNNFYHGATISDVLKGCSRIVFNELIDTATGKAFEIVKHEDYTTLDDLKQLFKILNTDYPIDERELSLKMSTKNIDNKQLGDHIDFIIKTVGESGYEVSFVREEWERIMKDVKNV